WTRTPTSSQTPWSAWSTSSASSADGCLEGGQRVAAGIGTAAGQVGGDALQHGVDRRGHPVQATEQHDLAVEVVGLDAACPPGQALPRRAPTPPAALDRAHLH